jgi:hypothetical protein
MPKNLAWTQQQVDSMLPSPAKLRQKINNYDKHKAQSLLQIIILNLKNIQGFGSGSAWIRINLSCWIRIRIRIQIADLDTGGQK